MANVVSPIAETWRMPEMRWFPWKKQQRADVVTDDLTAARADTDTSLAEARAHRDTQQRWLREERRSVVEPLRAARRSNHLSELAMRALRGE